jgi:hypothetical protein
LRCLPSHRHPQPHQHSLCSPLSPRLPQPPQPSVSAC